MKQIYETEKKICFPEAEDIKEFVDVASKCDFDIDVFYQRAMIDAKSLLGMLAIGNSRNIAVCYGGKDEHLEKMISKFAIA